MILKTVLILFVAAGLACARDAEAPPAWKHLNLSLGIAIRMALEKNFSIVAQKMDPQISRGRLQSAYGRFDPAFSLSYRNGEFSVADTFVRDASGNVGISGGGSRDHTEQWSTRVNGVTAWGLGYDMGLTSEIRDGNAASSGSTYESTMSFSLRQPLLRGAGPAANLAGVRLARNNVTISEWSVRQQVINVITEVIEVYNELQFATENLEVAQRSRNLAMQLLRDNIKRVEIGVKTPLDVTTAQADAAARLGAVIRTTREVKDQKNFLERLTSGDMLMMLRTELKIQPPPSAPFEPDVIGGIQAALDLRPDYRQSVLDIQNRHIAVAFTKTELLPRLDLVASLSLLGLDDDFGHSIERALEPQRSSWNIGATFSIPLGNRDNRGRYNAAKLEATQALVKLQQLEQQIIVLVDNASGAVTTARQQMDATREARRLAKESLTAGEGRLVAGIGTTFEVLELQKRLAEAETAELRARADYNKAVARYNLQTGTTLRVHGVVID